MARLGGRSWSLGGTSGGASLRGGPTSGSDLHNVGPSSRGTRRRTRGGADCEGGRGSACEGGRGSACEGGRGSACEGGRGSACEGGRGSACEGGRGSACEGGRGSACEGGRGSALRHSGAAISREIDAALPRAPLTRPPATTPTPGLRSCRGFPDSAEDSRIRSGSQGSRPWRAVGSPFVKSSSEYSLSLLSLCEPSISRTVPDLERIINDWVVQRCAR
ncbi:hypothetical protein SAMN04487904_110107 [Actinopolyspora lacussalsi subsp. righensis]|uniref:Uncharacterized protein n=1 Tax=Actinopolyspora righensis TaxID=995060 RepID=A0A1I7BBP0_9ACTN|nr:hypothetical protein SAMN04487904_110107 [Actinopolyspora righensis]